MVTETTSRDRTQTLRADRTALIVGLGLFLLAFVLRALYVDSLSEVFADFRLPREGFDQRTHYEVAIGLLEGTYDRVFYLSPGYSFYFLQIFLWLFQGSVYWVKMMQAAVSAFTVLATFHIARRCFSLEIGVVSGLLLVLCYVHIAVTGFMLVESVAIAELVAAIWAFVMYRWSDRLRWLCVSSVLLGLAVVTRPNFLPVAILVIGVGAFASRGRCKPCTFMRSVLCFAIPFLPIAYHNLRSPDDEIALLSTNAAVNLKIGLNPDANGVFEYAPAFADGWYVREAPAGSGDSGCAWREVTGAVDAVAAAVKRPIEYVDLVSRKVGLILRPDITKGNVRYDTDVARTWLGSGRWFVQFWHLVPLAVIGALLVPSRRSRMSHLVLVATPLLLAAPLVLLFFVNSRLRLPLVPFLAVLAGCGLVGIGRALRARNWRGLGLCFGLWILSATVVHGFHAGYGRFLHPWLQRMSAPEGIHRVYGDRFEVRDVWWSAGVPAVNRQVKPGDRLRKVIVVPDCFVDQHAGKGRWTLALPVRPMTVDSQEPAELLLVVNEAYTCKLMWRSGDTGEGWQALAVEMDEGVLAAGANTIDLLVHGGSLQVGCERRLRYGRSLALVRGAWQPLEGNAEIRLRLTRPRI